jgi:hypothetical protein
MATMMVSPLFARVGGQASRRGLIPRVPSGDSLLGEIEAWMTAGYADAVRSTSRRVLENGEAQLAVALHPAATDLVVGTAEGGVAVAADTQGVGPGYHRFIGRLLERMETDLSITWELGGAEDADVPNEGVDLTFADRATTERAYLAWLGPALVGIRASRAAGRPGVQFGIPDGVRYTFDGAIATMLGPRDDEWLEAAVADTRIATDITPWWADATDAQCLLNRALCLMWLEVRWRPPAIASERVVVDEIHRLLSKAFPLDPMLPYPWRAWAELVELRGIDDPMARQLADRAARDPDGVQIGYRRAPVTITHEGWSLTVPGSFAERRSPDEWWGGGAGRNITLAAVPTGAMGAREFIEEYAGGLGADAIDHQAGAVLGRATLTTDASSGVEVGVLEGYSAVVGTGAATRIEFDDAADWQWALDTWRALAPA